MNVKNLLLLVTVLLISHTASAKWENKNDRANPAEYPFMVSIHSVPADGMAAGYAASSSLQDNYLCTGAWISKNHVLTSALCVQDRTPAMLTVAYSQNADHLENPASAHTLQIVSITRHTAADGLEDVAIIETAPDPTNHHSLVALPTDSNAVDASALLGVLGWKSAPGARAAALRHADAALCDILLQKQLGKLVADISAKIMQKTSSGQYPLMGVLLTNFSGRRSGDATGHHNVCLRLDNSALLDWIRSTTTH